MHGDSVDAVPCHNYFISHRADLMHQRLQAWLREHTCEDIAYLGEQEDKDGEMKHLYRIGEHEVFHDMIHELEMTEVEDDEE